MEVRPIAGARAAVRAARLIDGLAAADADPRVKAMLGYVPDESVAEPYEASDAALCPRQERAPGIAFRQELLERARDRPDGSPALYRPRRR